jgi:preprotein translocase subunit SecG
MGVLGTVLLVFFIIVAILLVLLVLVQGEEGDSLGGIFTGGSSSAFGSRSGTVLTKATSVLGALFLILSFSLALVNRTSNGSGVEAVGRQLSTESTGNDWVESELSGKSDASSTFVIPNETSVPAAGGETPAAADTAEYGRSDTSIITPNETSVPADGEMPAADTVE